MKIPMTDSEWVFLMKESPEKGYRALIDQYGNVVYAIVLNKIKNVASREDIEDCVSDIFVEMFQNAFNYSESSGTVKGYLSTIAKRRAIDSYRRLSGHNNKTTSIDDELIELPPSNDNPAQEAEMKITKRNLWKSIQNLGEPDTSIVTLQYFYDKSASEIGSLLKMTAAAVQKRSVRAREKLRKILSTEMNVTSSEFFEGI